MATGRVPLLDENGRFPDRFAPESVAVDAAAAGVAASEAVTAASGAAQAAVDAVAAKEAAEAVPAQVDTAMAEQVGAGGAFDTKLSATSVQVAQATISATREPLNALTTAQRGKQPRILSLVIGSEDERAASTVVAGTLALDTEHYKFGGQALRALSNPGQQVLTWTIPLPSTPMPTPAWQAIGLWVYVPNPAAVGNMVIIVYPTASLAVADRMEYRTNGVDLVAGWNFLRMPATTGSDFTQIMHRQEHTHIHRIDLRAVWTAEATPTQQSITVGHLYLECPPKARFLIIADRGYKTFYEGIYPEMKSRGWPVTFAVDVTLFGSQAGTKWEAMSEAQMHHVATENGNSISFHGYDGQPTSQMTVEELRRDTTKALKWLQQHDYSGRVWRASYVQNSAAQAEAMRDYLVGAASGTPGENLGPTVWPPDDLHNIPRFSIDSHKTDQVIDRMFIHAKNTHMTYLPFFHGMSDYEWDTPPTKWARFRDHLDQAIADGWAETVTFEQLFLEMGGSFSTVGGGMVAEYTDALTGERIVKTVL